MFKIINIIVAIDNNRGIGREGELLANIPEDMKHFREVTKNSIVIMGRKTYESLKVKPLPNRINIVISSNFCCDGIESCICLEDALEIAREASKREGKDIFIIGGASIYEQTLPMADRLYVTHILGDYEADKFFPEFHNKGFVHTSSWSHKENIQSKHPHIFSIYDKIQDL